MPAPDSHASEPARNEATPGDPAAGRDTGFTLDLSSSDPKRQPEAWRRKRKTASPVLTKIVDLSTPTDAQPKTTTPAASEQKPKAEKRPRKQTRRDAKRPSGNSLADLLDPETLARLRGDD